MILGGDYFWYCNPLRYANCSLLSPGDVRESLVLVEGRAIHVYHTCVCGLLVVPADKLVAAVQLPVQADAKSLVL